MSEFNFIVSYLDSNGDKHDEAVSLDSQDYKKHYQENFSILMQNYPPDQAETHILATKKHYIEKNIANQLGKNTPVTYDIAEIMNTLDRDIKGIL